MRVVSQEGVKSFVGGFPAGTVVSHCNIEEVTVGQVVGVYDTRRVLFRQCKVSKIHKRPVQVLLKVLFSSGSSLFCTPDQAIITGVGWRKVGSLMPHDFILNVFPNATRYVQVVGIQYLGESKTKKYCPGGVTYQLELENSATYLVGEGYVVRACQP